jgi:beta-N-acetylhexosaminidase
MSRRERIGQLLLVGTPAARPGAEARTVERYRVGGVFLVGRSDSAAAQVRREVRRLQTGVPALRSRAAVGAPRLLVAVDQEGGKVQTLRGPGFTTVPAAAVQAGWPVERVRALTATWAAELSGVGVTLDLAPVADTVPAGRERENPPIGVPGRQYGAAADDVAERVVAVSSELRRHRVLATLKHFPGLGRVRVNTDAGTGAVDARTDAGDPHLEPFSAGLRAGAQVVMVSSAVYPRLDPSRPAAFSEAVVDGLLRRRLGWDGLVVSDDLGRAKGVQGVETGRRAVDFVAAGGDLVLTVRAVDVPRMVGALLDRETRDAAFRARVDESALRVLAAKRSVGLLRCEEVER